MVKVKICGMRRQEDIVCANSLHPDYVGFIFANSRRRVSPVQAAMLRGCLHTDIQAVGVFVNEEPEQIRELCERGIIDVVQLHGDEDETYIEGLRRQVDVPIVKAIRVRSAEDVLAGERLACDYLLLDSYTESAYGGSGQEFDLRLLPEIEKPYFLAGGLTPENVRGKLKQCTPFAVDASSGVEGADGFKDFGRMKKFINRVREVS